MKITGCPVLGGFAVEHQFQSDPCIYTGSAAPGEMGNEYKRIILLKGLQPIGDFQFSMVKSLLAHDLGLTTKMQEEYNKVKIADLMEKKFRGPLCVDKLIDLLKDIEGLGDVVKTLRNEKRKVMRQSRAGAKAPMKKRKQDASGTDESTSSTNEASGSVHDKPLSKKKKKETTQNDESKRTQPTQEQSQLLEPSVTSTQSTWSYPQTPPMPPPTPGSSSSTKKRKIKTTQNDESKRMQPPQGQSQLPGPSVSSTQSTWSYPQTPPMPPPTPGSSSSTKKKKIKTTQNDESKRMQPPQGQIQLPGPSVSSTQSTWSYPQTPPMPPPTLGSSSSTKKKKIKTTQNDESKRMQPPQGQIQLPGPSVSSTQSTWSYPQTPPMPPPTLGSSSSTKKRKIKTTQNDESKRMQPPQGQSQLPGLSLTSTQSTWSYPQTPPMPPPTPGSSSSTKKVKMETTQNDESKRIQPLQGQSQLLGPSVTSTQTTWGYPQTPLMPPPTPGNSSSTKKPRLKVVPRAPSIEEGFQKGPKEVMVLRATEPFAYDLMEGERKMFHATVATESQFFQVKVFHVDLKEKFIPKKVIAISDYYGRNGFLEVYDAACVSDVNADRKMEISSRLIQNANATPKINSLYSQGPGTFVSGIYQVHKKNVLNEHIIWYEIQDETGKMEVLVYGRLTKVNCEEGDKLKLICFELSAEPRQLRSVIHSFIKVIKSRKNKKPLINPVSHMETSL
ncbi:gamma-interferon-inducible protein 16-like isoform X5 [Ursus americanus]|uniref:gamma-interferon-inducible protein 16-like isoform X5 n=1 Tax=Ursus americanus TaxID=9643 RepID=UPI001E67B71E|nr:gamma-interferon-inducible protein 16-like isoform X5 [Ursus americanus]